MELWIFLSVFVGIVLLIVTALYTNPIEWILL